jgi:formate/nitrite transporter FocA (FNT family)
MEGEHEIKRQPFALASSGLAAGLSMGFSLITEGLIRAQLPNQPWRPLVSHFGYCAGFLIVVLGRQQLFTENTLTAILPLLQAPTAKVLLRVLRLWVIVLIANVVGCFLFAWLVGHSDIFSPEVKQSFAELAQESLRATWSTTFIHGIFAGWLIAMMVWLLPASDSASIWVVIIMTYLVALGNHSHIIAGSTKVFYAATVGLAPWSFYFQWMIPTLFGNILGGVSLVALLGRAQVIE